MRNRAKCKLCKSVIESFHRYDYVSCKCGEIAVDGGTDYLRSTAKDYKNFVRVDDLNNEIDVKLVNKEDVKETKEELKEEKKMTLVTLKDHSKELDHYIKTIEQLPEAALSSYITHYDLLTVLLLLSSTLKTLEDELGKCD